MRVEFIQFEDKSLTDFINSKIVPLTPGSVIPEFFLFGTAIDAFDFLELLHKIQVDGDNFGGSLE